MAYLGLGTATTTTSLATYASYAATALTVLSSIKSAQFQAAAARQASEAADRNAQGAITQTAQEIGRIRRMALVRRGSIRAGFAASGVSMEGTPLEVLEQSTTQAGIDVNTVRYLGYLRAQGAAVDSSLYRLREESATEGGYLKAAGTLLSAYSLSPVKKISTEGHELLNE